MKKIIGYKLKEGCEKYVDAVKKITGCIYFKSEFSTDSSCCESLKAARVLQLWFEPVYEEPFEDREWLYLTDGSNEWLQRYNDGEGYKLCKNNSIYEIDLWTAYDDSLIGRGEYTKATQEQIERILTKVAESKGFKEGCSFNQEYYNNTVKNIKEYHIRFCYLNRKDILRFNGWDIYMGGKWATIITKEKEKEKTEIEKFIEWADKKYISARPLYPQPLQDSSIIFFKSIEGIYKEYLEETKQ